MPGPATAVSPDPTHARLTELPGHGPRVAAKLAPRGLLTLQDLWLHLPRQYEDRTALTPIRVLVCGVDAKVGGIVTPLARCVGYRPRVLVAILPTSPHPQDPTTFHF